MSKGNYVKQYLYKYLNGSTGAAVSAFGVIVCICMSRVLKAVVR